MMLFNSFWDVKLKLSYQYDVKQAFLFIPPSAMHQSTIVSEGFKGGTRGALIINVERNGGHKWVYYLPNIAMPA